MSVSPLKRSASDAQLSSRRTSKFARTSVSDIGSEVALDLRMPQEQGVLAGWADVGRQSVRTFRSLSGALWSTFSYMQWKAMRVFCDTDELSLPTHTPTSISANHQLHSPTVPTFDDNEPTTSTPRRLPVQSNHSPTNLASTSSTSSFYPPPPLPFSSSASSSADFSSTNTTELNSTQASLPSSPPTSNAESEHTQTDSVRRLMNKNKQNGMLNGGVGKSYKRRRHIHEGQHRERVKEYLQRLLYDRTREMGYQSDFETFRGYIQYRRRLEEAQKHIPRQSHVGSRAHTPYLPQDDVEFFKRAMEKATKSLQSPKPPKPFNPKLDELTARTKFRNERIQDRLHPKSKPIPERLPSDALKEVNAVKRKRGIVSKAGREQVSDSDLARLAPGQWLNDEIINFYGQLIVDRVAEAEATKENEAGKVWNVHYFSTFFWPKLQSGYEKGRLAKWTKKIDIFSKDVILIPINHSNAHWTSAAIDFRRKRIVSYDSMGYPRTEVYNALRTYLDEEHKNKKKKPFDFTGWEDYKSDTYPEQENGYDCGVFTCQTLEYLSRGVDKFNFTQQNMSYFRQRMIWEIGRAKLGDPL